MNRIVLAVLVGALGLVAGCSDSGGNSGPSGFAPASEASAYAEVPEPSDDADTEAYVEEAEDSASTAWEAEPRQEWEDRGYPCTQDCSGHDAGYQWAEDNGITDPDDCGGNSQSFIEGCQAYAEEQA